MTATATADPIRRADTNIEDASTAIDTLDAQLKLNASALTVFFCDPCYDLEAMTRSLNEKANGAPVIGCSSAGEIGLGGYTKKSIAAFSLDASDFTVATQTFTELKDFSSDDAHTVAAKALADLRAKGIDPNDSKCFALLLVDGLSAAEEPLTFKLQDALGAIPLIGGSAGDGLDFGKTHTFSEGSFGSDKAVLAVIHTTRPWEVFKEQHISPTDEKLVVTDADPDNRIIHEFNGEPAAVELAEAIGLDGPEQLTSAELAKHPLLLKLGGSWFVRSAHSVIDNNSLKLFCAIEEGLVLSLGRTENLPDSLDATLASYKERLGDIKLTIACDCILRRLELEATEQVQPASEILAKYKAIGFSTYGEQFGTVHVNQTLTGIVIG